MADSTNSFQKSAVSLGPRPVEISLVASYPNPWARNPAGEYKALGADQWSPHSGTFRAVADVPNQILRKCSGDPSCPALIRIVDVANLGEMARAITLLPNGKEREPGSLKRVNLFSHGNPGLIELRGSIDPKAHKVYLGDAAHAARPDVLMSEVDFSMTSTIDELAISWLNSCGTGIALRERIRGVFCRRQDCKAELWLIVCHGAGGRGDIDAGPGSILSRALASTLQVTVRAYSNPVWYWPTRDVRRSRIASEDRTSDGENGAPGLGYYSAENITDPETGKHLGEHMKKAETFEPDPQKEPFKVSCP